MFNKGSNFRHSTIPAAPYGRQWVKMCHIFGDQVIFYAPGCLLPLKYLCEWLYWRWVLISTTTSFFVTLKFRFFFGWLSIHICKTQKSFKRNPSFSIDLGNMSNMLIKILSAIVLKANSSNFSLLHIGVILPTVQCHNHLTS